MTRPEDSTPVFVDASGRRRRRVRRIAYAAGAACLTYTCLVAASVGHPARPDALALIPPPAQRPHPVVRQTRPPSEPTSGVPLPDSDRSPVEAVPTRLRARTRVAPPQRTESSPAPAPSTAPPAPAPTEPAPGPTGAPEPAPTDPPVPRPADPPPPPPPEEPPAEPAPGLPVVGPILDLLTGGSARR